MARKSVTIPTAIWRDPEFVGLGWRAQLLYLSLLTRPETTPAGTLPLRIRRWAAGSADGTPESVEADLVELEQAGWVLVDRETDEVALRLLVPAAGHKQLQARLAAASQVESASLRLALLEQFTDEGHDARRSSPANDSRVPRMRLEVYSRDGYKCLRCGWAPPVPNGYEGRHALGVVEFDATGGGYRVRILELDHIHPRSLGGKFEVSNLQTLCNCCNASKGAKVL